MGCTVSREFYDAEGFGDTPEIATNALQIELRYRFGMVPCDATSQRLYYYKTICSFNGKETVKYFRIVLNEISLPGNEKYKYCKAFLKPTNKPSFVEK